jgi:hypothetical protein
MKAYIIIDSEVALIVVCIIQGTVLSALCGVFIGMSLFHTYLIWIGAIFFVAWVLTQLPLIGAWKLITRDRFDLEETDHG